MPRGPEAARQRQNRRRMGRGVLCHSREPRAAPPAWRTRANRWNDTKLRPEARPCFYFCFFCLLYCCFSTASILLVAAFTASCPAARTSTPPRNPGSARHTKRTVQKQNACISGTDTGILLNDWPITYADPASRSVRGNDPRPYPSGSRAACDGGSPCAADRGGCGDLSRVP